MTTPKPPLQEALCHLCWALTHGKNADEDIRTLSAALERLEEYDTRPVFQTFATQPQGGPTMFRELEDENRALRAEVAALTKKLEEAESQLRALPTPDSALQNLGEYLTSLLDSDQWNHVVGYLEAARIYQQSIGAKLGRMEKGNYEGVAGIIALTEQLNQCARVRDQWKEDAQTFSEKAEFAEARADALDTLFKAAFITEAVLPLGEGAHNFVIALKDKYAAICAASLEQLSGNHGELDALRAEVAALKAKLEEVETTNDRLRQDRLDYSAATTTEGMNASEWIWRTGKAERERDAAESRAAELAARVEALEWSHRKVLMLTELDPWIRKILGDALSAGGTDFLAERDERIRRETVGNCHWSQDDYGWRTECGIFWIFNGDGTDGTPEDNGAFFCHHCGKHLVPVTNEDPAAGITEPNNQ